MLTIHPENPGDIEAIDRINRQAFRGDDEARLVEALRTAEAMILSLVAELDGAYVGHILFSPATVVDGGKSTPVVALAPMAVLPQHQRGGIGSKLVVEGLQLLRLMGHRAVAVLGHPEYYPRFGFGPSLNYGITCHYPAGPEYFMMLELREHTLDGVTGTVHYHPAFAAL